MKALDKHSIRQMIKQKRLSLDQKTLLTYSQQIINKVLLHPQYLKSKCIGIYVSLPQEVNTFSLIEQALQSKIVCTPKIEDGKMNFYQIRSLNDLKEGHFHVLEPTTSLFVKPQEIDCMIVPMVAYDHYNYRVGYGKGYYDKYFKEDFYGYKLGIAFDFQRVDKIDVDQYDVQLDEIITK